MKSSKLILKREQRFRSENHNAFIEGINEIVLGSNHNNNQSIDLVEGYAFGTSKDIVCKEEDFKYNNVLKQYKKFW